jgi:hypothetical protein
VSPLGAKQPVQPRRRFGDDLRGLVPHLLVPAAGDVRKRAVKLAYGVHPLAALLAPGASPGFRTAVRETVVAVLVVMHVPPKASPGAGSWPARLVRELVHGCAPVLDASRLSIAIC